MILPLRASTLDRRGAAFLEVLVFEQPQAQGAFADPGLASGGDRRRFEEGLERSRPWRAMPSRWLALSAPLAEISGLSRCSLIILSKPHFCGIYKCSLRNSRVRSSASNRPPGGRFASSAKRRFRCFFAGIGVRRSSPGHRHVGRATGSEATRRRVRVLTLPRRLPVLVHQSGEAALS